MLNYCIALLAALLKGISLLDNEVVQVASASACLDIYLGYDTLSRRWDNALGGSKNTLIQVFL
jgi:hypothetical protein